MNDDLEFAACELILNQLVAHFRMKFFKNLELYDFVAFDFEYSHHDMN